jgi:hypothetical protein
MQQRVFIETMESRTLLSAAAPGIPKAVLAQATASTDPAVQADLVAVQADVVAAAAAREKIKSDSVDTRAALRKTVDAGNDLLKADRTAVLIALSGTDVKAVSDAQAKLAADRVQVATDVAAAKSTVRASTGEGRAALQAARKSLREHVKQLRTTLRELARADKG